MTKEEANAIEEIQGTAGFRVMQSLAEQKLAKIESVLGINKDGLVAEQALARQLAHEVLSEFLNDIKLITPFNKDTRKTYE